MRKNVLIVLAGFGLVAVAGPKPANAYPVPTVSGCATNALKVCAGVYAVAGANNHLILNVWNLFGPGGTPGAVSSVITWVGIGQLGTASSMVTSYQGSPVGYFTGPPQNQTWHDAWALDNNITVNNFVGNEVSFAGVTTGVGYGLKGCGQAGQGIETCVGGSPSDRYLVLDFGLNASFELGNAVYGFHAQAANGTSCSLWFDNNGNTVGGSAAECQNVVPEPVTMALLGTGLLGLGGVGLVRRRRKNGDVTNA